MNSYYIHHYIILLIWPVARGLIQHIGTSVITLHHITFVQIVTQYQYNIYEETLVYCLKPPNLW